jgi:hypothetical protein
VDYWLDMTTTTIIRIKHPLSLRERARERGYKIKQLLLLDPLSPTLPLRGRE